MNKQPLSKLQGFPGGSVVKNPPRRHRFDPWVGKIPWRRKWQPAPVFLPRKCHGQRSLVDYSPWGHKGSDMTERLNSQPWRVRSPGLEEGMATHSSILARSIPWTEEPGVPQSMGSPRVWHDWVTNTHTWLDIPWVYKGICHNIKDTSTPCGFSKGRTLANQLSSVGRLPWIT